MKQVLAATFASVLLASLPSAVLAADATPAFQAAPIRCVPGQKVEQEGYLRIGGIDQWVSVKGENCANPVILYVHGGPGNPITPFADALYGSWRKDFTIVNWDQRGAGQTYARNPVDPETPQGALTMEQLTADGTELAAAMVKHLGKKQLILMGGSWGSILAVNMAHAKPALFGAYLGTGQYVSFAENEGGSLRKTLAMAKAANDTATVAALEALGAPPFVNPRAPGIVRKGTRIYEGKTTTPAPTSWWERTPAYATAQVLDNYEKGEEFSWLQFVGYKGNGMASKVDLRKLGMEFKMPVYMVMGAQDLVTVPEVAKPYFDAIRAPKKEYFLLPLVGHDPNQPMLDAQLTILRTRIAPLMK